MLTVSIQAGGGSTRMGEDKALKLFLGQPLIQRVIDRLSPIANEIIVTTNRPDDYAFINLRLVSDIVPGRGALGGLYTALFSATCDVVAVAACDMPFASSRLVKTATRLLVEEGADIVIPESATGLEPLHAVYRRVTCVPAIEAAIATNQWKVISWFPQVKVRVLKMDEIKRLDPSGLCFWNLNTPQEFAEAEQRARQAI